MPRLCRLLFKAAGRCWEGQSFTRTDKKPVCGVTRLNRLKVLIRIPLFLLSRYVLKKFCPIVRSDVKQLHWPITDPATDDPTVGLAEMMDRFRCAREEIQARLEQYNFEAGISSVKRI